MCAENQLEVERRRMVDSGGLLVARDPFLEAFQGYAVSTLGQP